MSNGPAEMKLTGNRCQCTICGEYFNSVAAFDKHRYWIDRTQRGCDTSKLVKNAGGYWVTRLQTANDRQRAHRGALVAVHSNGARRGAFHG